MFHYDDFLSVYQEKTYPNTYHNDKRKKVVPVFISLSIKPRRGKEKWSYSSTILDLGTRWRWELHTPASLPQGKEFSVPIGYKIGWAPETA
jgi:hypothetical protein